MNSKPLVEVSEKIYELIKINQKLSKKELKQHLPNVTADDLTICLQGLKNGGRIKYVANKWNIVLLESDTNKPTIKHTKTKKSIIMPDIKDHFINSLESFVIETMEFLLPNILESGCNGTLESTLQTTVKKEFDENVVPALLINVGHRVQTEVALQLEAYEKALSIQKIKMAELEAKLEKMKQGIVSSLEA